MSDSGVFQELESKYSGQFSDVPSQPSSHSKSSFFAEPRPNACHLIHGICPNHRETFFWQSPILCSSHHRHLVKEFFHSATPSATGVDPVQVSPGSTCRKRWRTNWEHDCNADVSKKAVNHEFFLQAEVPQKSTAVQQRPQISELQFEKIRHFFHQLSYCKTRFKTQVKFLFRFSLGCWCYGSKEVEVVNSVDEFKSSRSIAGWGFPEFWTAGRENCFYFEPDHTEFPLQKEGQSGGTESSDRRSVSSRKTDRLTWFSTTFESLELMMPFLIRRIYSLSLFAWRQCSGLRDEVGWNSIVYDQDPIGWCSGKSVHNWENVSLTRLKTVLQIVRHGNSSEDVDAQLSESWRPWWKRSIDQKLRSQNLGARNCEKIETGAVVTSRRGLSGIERAKRNLLSVESIRVSVREETNAVSDTTSRDREKPTPKAAPPSEPPTPRGRSASRKRTLRGRSQSGKSDSTAVQTTSRKALALRLHVWLLASSRMSIL